MAGSTLSTVLSVEGAATQNLSEVLAFLAYDPERLRFQGATTAQGRNLQRYSTVVGAGALAHLLLGDLTTDGALATSTFTAVGTPPSTPKELDDSVYLTFVRMQTREGEAVFVLPPTADAGFDQTVTLRPGGGVRVPDPTTPHDRPEHRRPWVTLDGTRSVDSRGRPLLGYDWSLLDGPEPVTPSAADTAVASFVPGQPGLYRFGLRVRNEECLSVLAVVSVRVNRFDAHAPTARIVATAGGARTDETLPPLAARIGDAIHFDGTQSSDSDVEDRDHLLYSWQPPTGFSFTPSSTHAKPTLVLEREGTFGVTLVVRDRGGLRSQTARVRITVTAGGNLPAVTVRSSSLDTGQAGQALGDGLARKRPASLSASLVQGIVTTIALKADVTPTESTTATTFQWRLVSGPSLELVGENTPFAEARPSAPGVYELELVATQGPAGEDSTAVTTRSRVRLLVESALSRLPVAAARVGRDQRAIGSKEPRRDGKVGGLAEAETQSNGSPEGHLPPSIRPLRGLLRTCFGRGLGAEPPGGLEYHQADLQAGAPGKGRASAAAEPTTLAVTAGETVQLSAAGSPAATPGRTVTRYHWQQTAGPAVELSDPSSPVATFAAPDLRDGRTHEVLFELTVDDGTLESEPLPLQVSVAPPGPATGPVPLGPGLNLIGFPVEPLTSGRLVTAGNLAAAFDLTFMTRLDSSPGASRRFVAFGPDGSADYPVEPGRGYFVFGGAGCVDREISGRAWGESSRQVSLGAGVNLVALPGTPPPAYNSSDLRRLCGAPFAARLEEATAGQPARFQVDLGAGSFPIRAGEGYVVSVPSAKVVSLP